MNQSKRILFLSNDNVDKVVRHLSPAYSEMQPPSVVRELTRRDMDAWERKNPLDAHESLVYDELTEIDFANREFIATKAAARGRVDVTRDFTADEYGLLDPERPENVTTARQRRGIPIWQTNRPKYIDADGGERQHASHDTIARHYDMSRVLTRLANQTVRKS